MKEHVNATVKKRLKITRHGTRLYGVSNLLGASVRHQIRIIFSSKLDTSIAELINSESHLQVSVVIRLVEVYILEFRNISLHAFISLSFHTVPSLAIAYVGMLLCITEGGRHGEVESISV